MDKDAKDFLEELKRANAEDIKKRVVARVEKMVESKGLSKDRLKEVEVDVSDFME